MQYVIDGISADITHKSIFYNAKNFKEFRLKLNILEANYEKRNEYCKNYFKIRYHSKVSLQKKVFGFLCGIFDRYR